MLRQIEDNHILTKLLQQYKLEWNKYPLCRLTINDCPNTQLFVWLEDHIQWPKYTSVSQSQKAAYL